MLDLTKKYFVDARVWPRETLKKWAKKNGLKLVGFAQRLPTHKKVIELDVRRGDSLHTDSKLGRSTLLNGARAIGKMWSEEIGKNAQMVVHPNIIN